MGRAQCRMDESSQNQNETRYNLRGQKQIVCVAREVGGSGKSLGPSLAAVAADRLTAYRQQQSRALGG